MAKWGEGDPRWIVEEREDGTNANNWHWTEKNATAWSKTTLTELLTGLVFADSAVGEAKVTEVDSISGDAIANCRKGKLIFFYELVITLKWKGTTAGGEVANGTIKIPNLSEEQDIEDITCETKLTSEATSERNKLKEVVRKRGADLIRGQLATWLKQLKEEYAVNLVKPTKKSNELKSPTVSADSSGTDTLGTPIAASQASPEKPKPKPAPVKKETEYKTFSLSDEFKCRRMELFRALVEEPQVKAYTQSDCKIDPKIGGEFSLFGGNVTGVFQELVPGEKIKQAWRFKHWPAGHFSDVTLEITESDDKSKLTLTQSGVPEGDLESCKVGWRSHQWDRMKAILGFGSGISFGL